MNCYFFLHKSNKTRYRQWFDRCIISKMILKSGSNWLFPVVISVEITLSGSHSGNSFEFSHRLTGFLNYALFWHNKRSLSDARSKSCSFASVATATQIILATLPLYSQNATWRLSTASTGFGWFMVFDATFNKMILKSGSNWLFPVVISVEITLSRSHSGNSFEFSHRLTGFLNYALFCLSFCLRLNLKPINYLTTRRSSMTNSRSP
jgi:hypothetical protein